MGYALGVVNVVDSANTTIGQYGTPVSFDAGFPLSNITVRQLSTIAKTAADQNVLDLTFENTTSGFGANPIIAVMALSSLQNDYEFEISGSNVALGDDEVFFVTGSVVRPGAEGDPTRDEFPLSFFQKITAASVQYIRLKITASATVDAPFELGRVWIGPSVPTTTERNESLVGGLLLGGDNETAWGGQAHGSTSNSLRRCQVTISSLTDAEKQVMMRALAYAGKGREFVYMRVVSDSTEAENSYKRDNSFYAHIDGEVDFTAQAARDLNTLTFGFVEER
jgi:ribosomal protein L27